MSGCSFFMDPELAAGLTSRDSRWALRAGGGTNVFWEALLLSQPLAASPEGTGRKAAHRELGGIKLELRPRSESG